MLIICLSSCYWETLPTSVTSLIQDYELLLNINFYVSLSIFILTFSSKTVFVMVLICLFVSSFQLVFLLISAVSGFDQVVYSSCSSTTGCQSEDGLFNDPQLHEAIASAHKRLAECLRSCADVLRCNPSVSSGYYQIQAANGSLVQVYCDMEGANCGGEGGWTRVAFLNATDPSSQCPTNFNIMSVNGTRFCIRDQEDCVPLPSNTFGISYSQVCGYVRGYSLRSTDSFGGRSPNQPLSGNYVDGVSITYGSPPNHLWTYVAGYSEDESDNQLLNCPCNSNIMNSSPSFVGNDYYCEAGGDISSSSQWFTDDPLWDGKLCRGNEVPCCNGTSLPWFMKHLPSQTVSSVEVRLCADQQFVDENIGLERLEMFVK